MLRAQPGPREAAIGGGMLGLAPTLLVAQAALAGRVSAAADGRPLGGVSITVPALGVSAHTDSAGFYRFASLAPGVYLVIAQTPGFAPDSSRVAVGVVPVAAHDVALRRITVLGPVRVAVPRPVPSIMRGFEERRALGRGHFIDRALLEKHAQRQTGEVIAQHAPGLRLWRGGSRAWATSARGPGTGMCAMCGERQELDRGDASAGARPACYMDVYLDGALVYNSAARGGAPLFDLNGLRPAQLEGVEVYAGAAQVPPQYNRTAGGCGVVLLWTRAAP